MLMATPSAGKSGCRVGERRVLCPRGTEFQAGEEIALARTSAQATASVGSDVMWGRGEVCVHAATGLVHRAARQQQVGTRDTDRS